MLAFAAVFLFGRQFHSLRVFANHERSLLSFSAGVAVGYVFVRVMPDLEGARRDFVKWTILPKVFDGMFVYFFALIGVLFFYCLDHFSKQARLAASAAGRSTPDFDITFIGWAGYVGLISYLLMSRSSPASLATYAIAMAAQFLNFEHWFGIELGDGYQRRGRFLLAAAAPIGWGLSLAFDLPRGALALMLAFLSGGVIVNAMFVELPDDKDGRLWPFVTGSVLSAMLLIPL